MLNLKATMEGFNARMEDGEDSNTSVSIDQQIEIEAGAAEEAETVAETSEEINEADDVADEAEELMAQFAIVDHMDSVVSVTGWSRPVAMAFNSHNEIEDNFNVYGLPAMENLEMIASPMDSTSVMVLEGFKETMKDFWEWIKKICRKIADAVVNLAERVTAMFMGIDRVSRRLANAIKEADINPEKMKEKKATLLKRPVWNTAFSFFKNGIAFAEKIASADKEKTAEEANRVKNLITETFKPSEMTVAESKWTVADCSKSDDVAYLVAASKTFSKAYATIKNMAKTTEAAAAREEKMSNTDPSGAKSTREEARNQVTMMTKSQQYVNALVKLGSSLAKEHVKAQRAVFACRGKADKSDKK